MQIELSLFGAFREFEANARLELTLADAACVRDLRNELQNYGEKHWPGFKPGLLARSVFASETSILRDAERLPDDGKLALLPPVSGG